MPRVALSYRRDDSAGIARLIYERLKVRYGADSVFMDIDAIEFGEDYRERINLALEQTDCLLVLIGSRWLGPTSSDRNRINDAGDPVRMEVERAFEIGLRVVPVLLEHTQMPGTADLPDALRRLAYLNAAEVTSGRDFDGQIDRIIRFIDRTFAETETRRAQEDVLQERDEVARNDTRRAATAAHKEQDEYARTPRPDDPTPSRRFSAKGFVITILTLGALLFAYVMWVQAPRASTAVTPVPIGMPTASVTPEPIARFPERTSLAVPAGFVSYDADKVLAAPGLFFKSQGHCIQHGSSAQIGIRFFNDYRATANFDVNLTGDDTYFWNGWIRERQHVATGLSPEVFLKAMNFTCGRTKTLISDVRWLRFGADRGKYVFGDHNNSTDAQHPIR